MKLIFDFRKYGGMWLTVVRMLTLFQNRNIGPLGRSWPLSLSILAKTGGSRPKTAVFEGKRPIMLNSAFCIDYPIFIPSASIKV